MSLGERGEQNPARPTPCLGERSHQVLYIIHSVVSITIINRMPAVCNKGLVD